MNVLYKMINFIHQSPAADMIFISSLPSDLVTRLTGQHTELQWNYFRTYMRCCQTYINIRVNWEIIIILWKNLLLIQCHVYINHTWYLVIVPSNIPGILLQKCAGLLHL